MMFGREFVRRAKRRWPLFVVLIALGAGAAALVIEQRDERAAWSMHLVVRPSPNLEPRDVPGALEVLEPDGSLLNTLLGVVASDGFVSGAVRDAGVDSGASSIDVVLRPGSTIFDVSVTALDAESARRFADAYGDRATSYVSENFGAYVLDALSGRPGRTDPTLSTPQAIGAGALVGALVAAAFVAWPAWRASRRLEDIAGDDRAPVALTPEPARADGEAGKARTAR